MSEFSQVSMLESVGIDPADERVYRALLRDPGNTADELAAALNIHATELSPAVDRLEQLGMITRTPDRPPRLIPSRPDVAVDALVARRHAELDQASAGARELLSEMAVDEEYRPENLVEVIVGQRAIATRFEQLLQSTREELLVLDRPPYASPPDESENGVLGLLDGGVQVRGIYSPDSLRPPGAVKRAYSAAEAGETSRVHPDVPMKLAIADGSQALLPLAVDRLVDSALVVRASALLDALTRMFNLLWEQALPVVPGVCDRELTNTDRRLLTMLASGMPDEAIARQLEVSNRTVGRRVASLMQLLGVRSRFQAGVYAVRNSLIPEDG